MNKYYFSFGHGHVHRLNNKTFDVDCLLEIEAEDVGKARDIMFENFGPKWSMQYNDLPDMRHFPRGVMTLAQELIPLAYHEL